MKRIHRSCVAVLLLLAMLLSCVPAIAAGSRGFTTQQKAEALKTLGIFQGTKKGFELEGTLTREQAVTLIVRLLGAEAEAKEKNPEHPFTDVWAWASPYVGYGYQNNLVKGMGGTTFGYGQLVTEAQFLTMLLRVLQYEDGTDFTWSKSAELAGELGLPVVGSERDYTRGNAVDVIWELLKLTFKSGKQTLAEMLIEKGVFTEKAYRDLLDEEKNGSKPSKPSTPVTPEPVPDPEPEPEEPTEQAIYVSPNGGSDGDGSKDAPFGSLEAVRDYLRENRSTELPTTVYLRGGTYVLNKTFELTEADGGTEELPVTWRAYPGETVTITGSAGASLSAFEPVSGEMKEKLSPDAQEHVVVADVRDLGLGEISFSLSALNLCLEAPLFSLDGQHMRLTRYPNSNSTEDWMHVETVNPNSSTSYPEFKLTDERVLGWSYQESDWLYSSYIRYGWAQGYFHGTLNRETGIVTATDTAYYGSAAGQKPVQIYNAYESLDEPGEWYYDQMSGRLYIYPFADTTRNSTLRMTSSNFDLISVNGASYLNLEGLTVTSSKKDGIVMNNVDHCVIDNCTLTNFEGRAVSIDNATYSGLKNSEVAYTSISAIYLNGGDYQTMEPGYDFITNCRIHDTNQYRTMNEGGVKFRGVKNTFSNNEVYNITDMALNFAIVGGGPTSLDCVIENNSFHDVVLNGKDLGAVYGGRDARCQGVVIRNNHFYNIANNDSSFPSFSANAVYLDDGLSGAAVTGNIFGPGASGDYLEAVKINCGHDTVITNNLFIDTRCVFNVYIAGNFAVGMTNDSGFGISPSLREVWNNELYTSRWPWMAALRDGETDVYIPNIFKNNVIIYTDAAPRGSETSAYPWVKTNDNQESKISGLDGNLVILKGTDDNRQLFADYENGNYALADSVLAQLPGFEQIDQSKIGVKSFPGNQKPAASGVSVSGTAEIGQTLNAVYTFSDADGDSEGATVVNFYISENQNESFYLNWKKVSDNMTRTEFTVTPICEGKWIRCKLTPVDSRGAQGTPVWSEPVFVAFTSHVDKTQFRALVDEAKAKVEAAQIGDEPGQWTQKEIDLITAAIADAEAVLAKDPISQYDFDLGVAAFQKAYTRFCNNQNAGTATDVIEIDALIEDTENWTPYSGNKEGKPTFVGGKLTLNATSAYQTSCYTGRTYSNKTFLFDYQQTLPEGNDGWGGFYFNMGDAADLPYSQKCILVVAKADQTELQIYDGANPLVMKVSKFAFENGKTYRVEFGLYDVNSTDVRAVLTVDGKEILSYEAENEYLHSAKGRFGVVASPNGMDVTLGSVGTKLTIDSLIDDEAGWKTTSGAPAPKFIAGKMILENGGYICVGYEGEKYTNRVLHFKYRQEFSEEAASEGWWAGLYFNGSDAVSPPWDDSGRSILVCIKDGVTELQIRDGSTREVLENTTYPLESGKTYRMTFGMYDVNSTDVRIVLTADDVTLFDVTRTNANLHGMAGYFGAVSSYTGIRMELGSLGNKVNVSTLVRDEANWTTYTGSKPEFKDGSLSITSSEASYELAAYTGEKFSGKVFNFKYKQVIPGDNWGGFYFNKSDPVAMPWADKGVLVVIKPYQVELQRYGDESGILKIATGEFFRSDMIYDVSFGIVDVNSTDVRIFVTVDGKTLFDETITDATLHGASGYFGAIAPAGGVQVTLNDLSGNDKHYNNLTELPLDAMIADKANWTDFSWAHFTTKPVFGDGTVSVTSTTEGYATLAGYSKEKYRNTEFQFKYQQRAAANDDGNYGLVIWTFDSNVTNLTWNSGGVMVAFEHGKTVLYAYGDAQNVPIAKSDLALEDGRTYDMTFSVCQISANQLRVVLKVDGEEWFNEVYTDAMLANTAGYFNVGACRDASATIEKTGKVVVPEPNPEPSYKVVDVTDMLADTANWTLGYDAPTFVPGSITAKTADGFSIGGYNTPVELDTVYRFKYKNVRATGWYDGFYLGFKPANIYWADGGVQVDFNDDSTAVHFFNGSQAVLEKAQSPSIESGKEYEIEFGLLKTGDDTVKLHLTINGTPYFTDVEVKNSVFVTTPLYFGIFSRGSEATISTMEDGPHYMLVDVTKMLADTSNWTMGYDAPTFAEGSITAKTADGFSIGGYNTPVELGTVYRFKYKNVRATGWYDGFYLGFKPANIYWADGGVQVDFNDDSTVLHCFNGSQAVLETTQSPSIESGKEYEIEFGLLKAGDDTVKVHLKINGTPYFADVEVKNSVFVTTPLYFGIFSRGSEATISTPNAK